MTRSRWFPPIVLIALAVPLFILGGVFSNDHGVKGVLGGIGWFGFLLCVLALIVWAVWAVVRSRRSQRVAT